MRLAGALLLTAIAASVIGGAGHRKLTDPPMSISKVELFTGEVTGYSAGSRVTFHFGSTTTGGTTGGTDGDEGGGYSLVQSRHEANEPSITQDSEVSLEDATSSRKTTTSTTTYYFLVQDDLISHLKVALLDPQPPVRSFSTVDDTVTPNQTLNLSGFEVSNGTDVEFSGTGTVKTAYLKLVVTREPFTDEDGHPKEHVTKYFTYSRNDYEISTSSLTAVAIDSRKSKGQPNLAGEVTADGNAPSRNVGFQGWTYKGGLFVGNTVGTADISGAARVQLYCSTTFTDPRAGCVSLIDLGSPSDFSASVPIFAKRPEDSTNLSVASSVVKWDTRWTITSPSTTTGALSLGIGRSADYANVQVGNGDMSKLAIVMASESTTAAWRYFGTEAYKTELSTASLTDGLASYGGPKLTVIDLLFHSDFSHTVGPTVEDPE